MTSCGFTPADIDDMTLFDIQALFSYWRDFPPAHEILKLAYGIERKPASKPSIGGHDPSGIGGLIARFPDGKVHAS
ncbi:hypothetical protein [Methyloferula stellata]|uniref:hypothetical protein n=1 Tax=Methyloferula stellata TaxID=876270 RepID=UPI00037C110D|nr:hypothetical protein [Methyloferula stellata]